MVDNKQIVKDCMTAWVNGNESKLRELTADSFRFNNPPEGISPDKEGNIEMANLYHNAFPDLSITFNDWVVEGDNVVVTWTGTGTHKNTFMGVEATNNKVTVDGISLLKIRNGKVIEDHTQFDSAGLLTQIGAIPKTVSTAV